MLSSSIRGTAGLWIFVACAFGVTTSVQSQVNSPSVAYPPPYSIQSQNAMGLQNQPQTQPQVAVQPNGQRVFNHTNNSTMAAPAQVQTAVPPSGANRQSTVQQASWTTETEAGKKDLPQGRVPIELKSSPKSSNSVDKPKSTWAAALSMFFSLAVVLSLFLSVAWLFRRSQPNAFIKLPKDVVQVMGRTSMAPRQQIYVVRFGNKMLLVSHQPGQTQTLGEITEPTEVERLAGLCEASQPNSVTHSFREVLSQVASGKTEDRSSARVSSRRLST
jgi:flagellar biogenesis protein FliO